MSLLFYPDVALARVYQVNLCERHSGSFITFPAPVVVVNATIPTSCANPEKKHFVKKPPKHLGQIVTAPIIDFTVAKQRTLPAYCKIMMFGNFPSRPLNKKDTCKFRKARICGQFMAELRCSTQLFLQGRKGSRCTACIVLCRVFVHAAQHALRPLTLQSVFCMPRANVLFFFVQVTPLCVCTLCARRRSEAALPPEGSVVVESF